jgi:hypothetical protein
VTIRCMLPASPSPSAPAFSNLSFCFHATRYDARER